MTLLKKPEPSDVRGICVLCKEYEQSSWGAGKFRSLCNRCHNKRYPRVSEYRRKYVAERRKNEEYVLLESGKRAIVGYKKYKKDHCEKCGFVAEHSCQLDIDHIDGDKGNSDPSNYQTLCSNCHRLKTYLNRDYLNKKKKEEQHEKN